MWSTRYTCCRARTSRWRTHTLTSQNSGAKKNLTLATLFIWRMIQVRHCSSTIPRLSIPAILCRKSSRSSFLNLFRVVQTMESSKRCLSRTPSWNLAMVLWHTGIYSMHFCCFSLSSHWWMFQSFLSTTVEKATLRMSGAQMETRPILLVISGILVFSVIQVHLKLNMS